MKAKEWQEEVAPCRITHVATSIHDMKFPIIQVTSGDIHERRTLSGFGCRERLRLLFCTTRQRRKSRSLDDIASSHALWCYCCCCVLQSSCRT
jgi:hypothetical protein